MQVNGVARTVLIQVIHYRFDNSYVASVLKRYPGIFAGVCRVDVEGVGGPLRLSDRGWIEEGELVVESPVVGPCLFAPAGYV